MKGLWLRRGGLSCLVLPQYGGMVGGVWLGERPVLRLEEGLLGRREALAGGIPLLFPFAGRCAGERVLIDGTHCPMPMHGFIRNMAFSVLRQWPDGCRLGLEVDNWPPYRLALTLDYHLEAGALVTSLRVRSLSPTALPMALGFHPYFRVEDRAGAKLAVGLEAYWDHLVQPPRRGVLTGPVNLTLDWDHVFQGQGVEATLICPAEGYGVRLTGDSSFKVVTLCTTQPGAVCVEPWQAPPDPVASGRARWLAPGGEERFGYRIALGKPTNRAFLSAAF